MLCWDDFSLDDLVLRKIKRAEQAARRLEGQTSDIEPDIEDEKPRAVKREKPSHGENRRLVEAESDDEF